MKEAIITIDFALGTVVLLILGLSLPGMRGTHEYRAWLLGRNRYFQRQEGPTRTTHHIAGDE
jgi:hypothetical protein